MKLPVIFSLVALSLAVYFSSLHNQFLIDDWSVLFQRNITPDLDHIWKAIDYTNTSKVYYRPVTALLRCFLVAGFGMDSFYYHLFNVSLFAVHVVLMFLLLRKICKESAVPLIATILYCVHPINSTAVNYITAHEVLLMGILMDLSVLFFLRNLQGQNTVRPSYLSLFFYSAGLLVQEISVVVPVILFFICFQLKGWSLRKTLKLTAPYWAVAILYVALRLLFVKNTAASIHIIVNTINANGINFFIYVNTLCKLLAWYLSKLFLPFGILLIQNSRPEALNMVQNFVLVVLSCAGLFFMFRHNWRGNKVLFALLWLISGFIPLAGITLVYGHFTIEPHWFFFSSMGFFLLCGLLFDRVYSSSKKLFSRALFVLLFSALLLIWLSITQIYNRLWQDEKTYCTYWLSLAPDASLPNFWLAQSFLVENKLVAAEYYFKKALKGKYLDWVIYSNLGDTRRYAGDWKGAQEYYLMALKLNPSANVFGANLGKTIGRPGAAQ